MPNAPDHPPGKNQSPSSEPSQTGELVAYLTSLALHMLLLIALASIASRANDLHSLVINMAVTEEPEIEDVELKESDANPFTLGQDFPTFPEPDPILPLPKDEVPIPEIPDPEPDPLELFRDEEDRIRNRPVPLEDNPIFRAPDMPEAVDLLALELLKLLAEKKLLVVWCFDESESMKDERHLIQVRIERIYREIGKHKNGRDGRLLTAVTSFGSSWKLDHLKKQTDDYQLIASAIKNIQPDASGIENFCSAVHESIKYYVQRKRNSSRGLVLVLITDESGNPADIEANLEESIRAAKKCECPVYVIGYEAMFGSRKRYVEMTDSDTKDLIRSSVDSGPESVEVEQLQQDPFGSPFETYWSGYGPYAQVRLARKTGGKFILLSDHAEKSPSKKGERGYFQHNMLAYAPDWCSRDEYVKEVASSDFRKTLMDVIFWLDPKRNEKARKFHLSQSFSGPNQLKEMSAEIPDAHVWTQQIGEALTRVKFLETMRAAETSKRWQANFDLLYAQLLVQRILVNEYIACLSKTKESIMTQTGPRTLMNWELVRCPKPTYYPVSTELLGEVRQALNRIIADHAGTPWALRAEHELQKGFGFKPKKIVQGKPAPKPVYKDILL